MWPRLKNHSRIEFTVVNITSGELTNYYSTVNASISANHDLMLSVLEGGSLRLSCTSIGAPTPTIVWEMNGQPAQFNTTEVTTMPQIRIFGAPGGGLSPDVILGNITSEILIVGAQYPSENGTYTCIGSSDDFDTNSSALIQVQVLSGVIIELTVTNYSGFVTWVIRLHVYYTYTVLLYYIQTSGVG
jgi:hypothetical protein